MQGPPIIFDPNTIQQRRRRVRADAMFLQTAARDEVLERRKDINRSFTKTAVVTPFPNIWENHADHIIAPNDDLAIQPDTYDLIIHALNLHHMNDPLGQMIQCLRGLKPDGLFLGTTFGGETLSALRQALVAAESAITGGVSPRVAPMMDIRDVGSLMQRTGFALPVVDTQDLTVNYTSLTHMMHDLRHMGEANVQENRIKHASSRQMFARAHAEYPSVDGTFPAQFQILHLAGWAPHDSQQKPLKPGSAKISLIDALNPNKSPHSD